MHGVLSQAACSQVHYHHCDMLAAHPATGAREGEEVMEVRQVWRQAHLKQPLGSRDGSRTRQRGGSGPKSTTGGSRGGSSGMGRAGGVLHQITSK